MASFKLTIRHGSKVVHEEHPTLEQALGALRASSERIRSEGDLPEVSMLRTYEPGDRVNARLEISTPGVLSGRDAGLDVMGDGALVPFRGGLRRHPVEPASGESPYDAIETALRGAGRRGR